MSSSRSSPLVCRAVRVAGREEGEEVRVLPPHHTSSASEASEEEKKSGDDVLGVFQTLASSSALFDPLPEPEPSEAFPKETYLGARGILSTDTLPPAPAQMTLECKPPSELKNMFEPATLWPLRACMVQQDDPALLVQNNQEKLLNSSVKKQVLGHSYVSDCAADKCANEEDISLARDFALLNTIVDSFDLDISIPCKEDSLDDKCKGHLSLEQMKKLVIPTHVDYTFADTITGKLWENKDFFCESWKEDFLPPVLSSSEQTEKALSNADDVTSSSHYFHEKSRSFSVSSSSDLGVSHPVKKSFFPTPTSKYRIEEILNEDVDEEILQDFVTEIQDLAEENETVPDVSAVEVLTMPVDSAAKDTNVHLSTVQADLDDLSIDELLCDVSNAIQVASSHDPIPAASKSSSSQSEYKWASTETLPNSEFESLRPHLAVAYPFELDFFQKQAVMRLERRECVFVAAHTSAGKTVVAEYAIAMAKKHMSRTIYTSPIKALSNQKYRDFVEKFGSDVGLITGDMSVNIDASCLIMTTEILRSMLYRGSDTIRDIEWVIFDEVHYVNDAERGVVWEEVIIMLPERINLIFLSATTPNTIEFSDWIGRTKQRKVFVTSTPKRPVPLQHFFYHDEEVYPLMTPEGRFLPSAIQDAVARVKQKAMVKEKTPENAAMSAQRQQEKAAIAAQNRGGGSSKGGRGGGRGGGGRGPVASGGKVASVAGGKSQWLGLIKLLFNGGRVAAGGLKGVDFGEACTMRKGKSSAGTIGSLSSTKQAIKYDRLPQELKDQISPKEFALMDIRTDNSESHLLSDYGSEPEDESNAGLLPVVVFCFSKKKCEEIVDYLKSMDFLAAKEKAEVKKLMNQVANRLSPEDSRLPQIERMTELLLRGLAVHHGGLLPVLKEAVEILFSRSLVRVLFATETFAMGVNMPARAVVFNGYRKHDGKGFRDLLPGEYTQMAGRAGRRGKDAVGTVIIANFTDIPQNAEITFKTLLKGSATKLTSQFRLSYNMILNLLRVSDLSVEDMIKRSFSEFHMQRHMAKHDLGTRLKQLEKLTSVLQSKKEASEGSRSESLSDIEPFYQTFHESSRLLSAHLSHALATKGSSALKEIFKPGRYVVVNHVTKPEFSDSDIIAPCLGIILSDSLSSFSRDKDGDNKLKSSQAKKNAVVGVGLNMRSVASETSSEDSLSGCALSDLYLWMQLAVPCPCKVDASNDSTFYTVQKVSLDQMGIVLEKVSELPSQSLSHHLLGLPAPEEHVPNKPAESPSLAGSTFKGMKLKMKGHDDVDAMYGQPKKSKKNDPPKDSTKKSSDKASSSGETRAALVHLLGETLGELISHSFSLSEGSVNVLNVSTATKLKEFEFAESCQQHCSLARRTLNQFSSWRFYLTNMMELLTSSVSDLGLCHAMVAEFVDSFLLEHRINTAREKVDTLQHFSSSASLALFPDFQQRMRVLEYLGYIDAPESVGSVKNVDLTSSTVSLKGRVACEMNTCDELLATEVLFQNILEPLNPPEIASLLSAFVFQEKNEEDCELTSRLEVAREKVGLLHSRLLKLQEDMGVELIDSGQGKSGVNFGLAAVVYQWARGQSFHEITGMTLTHEGSIVRTMTRLDELCSDFRNAARVVGNPSLYRKMEATSQCIKRDIVFAASLYVS